MLLPTNRQSAQQPAEAVFHRLTSHVEIDWQRIEAAKIEVVAIDRFVAHQPYV